MARRKSKKALQAEYSALKEEYKKLAWKLDKQMYRIEKASHKSEYKGITKFAYSKMIAEIQNWSPGNTRWGQKLPEGEDLEAQVRALKKKLSVMKTLEKLPSFSLKKMKSIFGKAAKTLNKNSTYKAAGVQLTWQDLANFYGSSAAEVMDAKFGSGTTVIALGKFTQLSEDAKADLLEKIRSGKRVTIDDNRSVDQAIKYLLENYL